VRHPGRDPKNNRAFGRRTSPTIRRVYQFYCGRRTSRTRLKELITGWRWTGPVAESFWANQFRVLLTLRRTCCSRSCGAGGGHCLCRGAGHDAARAVAQAAVWVERSARRIVLDMPATSPGCRRGNGRPRSRARPNPRCPRALPCNQGRSVVVEGRPAPVTSLS